MWSFGAILAVFLPLAVRGMREESDLFLSMEADSICDTAPTSCACFIERDPNFCRTCTNCGPCTDFCSGATPAPTPAPTLPPPQCTVFGVEVVDTDMSGDLVAQKWAETADGCCPLCEETSGCEGFVYAPANQVCYLKGNFIGTFGAPGVVTRLKSTLGAGCPRFATAQQGKDLIGDLIEAWSAPSAEACCASCGKKAFCQGFAFFEGQCYLKTNVQGTYDKAGCVVHTKEGILDVPEPTQPLTPTSPQCPEFSTEVSDTDMSGDFLAAKTAATADGCCPLCEETSGCEGFVYAPANQVCYLKGNFIGTFGAPGVVTRLKSTLGAGCPGFAASQQGKDLSGDLIEAWPAPSQEACCASCGKKAFCQGFVFFEGQCYLKTNVQGTFDKPGAVSRVKGGALPEPTPAPPTTVEATSAPTQAPTTPAPTLAPTPASERCPEFKPLLLETDMWGTSLAQRDGVGSSDECCAFCDEMAACEGFAYNAPNRACYLKGGFVGTFPHGNAVTRLKSSLGAGCPGFDDPREDTDLVGALLQAWSAPDPEVCCAACARHGGCQGFVFFEGQCYLKAAVGGTYDNTGRVTRVKTGVLASA